MSDLIALLDATLRLISNTGTRTEKKKLSTLVKPGGYPFDRFLETLSQEEKENYQCGICFLIAKNPCHCLNKHQFCRSCVTVWAGSGDSENHNQCPVCRVKGYYLPSGKVADALNAKTVRCLLRSCVWTGQLRDMHYHRHILSKKISEEGQPQIHRKNSSSSDDSSDSDQESRTPSPSSSPVLPRIVTNSSLTTSLCSYGPGQEETPSSPSHDTFMQMLRSASSSVDMPPRSDSPTDTSVVNTMDTNPPSFVPVSAEVTPEVRCCTPRPCSPIPTPTSQVSTPPTTTANNTTTTTTGFPARRSILPNIQNTASANNTTSTAPDQLGPNHHHSSGHYTGPKEYERLRARMRETRVRLEQMEITRRELARFQERQRLQHLVEVRELGRQLNEVTFQIRRLLNQMSTTDNQNARPVTTTTVNNSNVSNNHRH